MSELLNNSIFGILITIATYKLGMIIYHKTRVSLFHPVLISILLIISILCVFNIKIEYYNYGGDLIKFFLGPATVILAVPLYRQFDTLKKHAFPILTGIFMGSITAILAVIALARLMHIKSEIALSLFPKSITTPIGIEVSKQIGGIQSITVIVIIITGIVGAVIAPSICSILRIRNSIAIGVAIGTSSHVIGTARALEIGESEGAMSSLAIGAAGLMVVFLAPLLVGLV